MIYWSLSIVYLKIIKAWSCFDVGSIDEIIGLYNNLRVIYKISIEKGNSVPVKELSERKLFL